MLKPTSFLILSIIVLLNFSCKNDTQNSDKIESENVAVDTVSELPRNRAAKKDLTPQDIAVIKSVMARVMNDGYLKRFASYLVTAELTDLLSNEDGPFTVFGPTDAAIESLSAEKRKFYSNPENKAQLIEMLKSHIVVGNFDKTTLMQTIDKGGKAKLKTLAGITLMVTKSGEELIVADGKGATAKVIKGSVEGSNGSVYVVDALLNAN
ncbi:MAG: hypothetical protein CL528_09275 [Aequorivita sp.]|jgi:uncharacterized surface protein with fasciclin (FAS1) repeats|nr:hypothetical protein [Aequorivita sp.]MBP41952.1 hypothetical protein [Aequorivita sp.]|tara:strand:- start:7296 stop:7922 length:627 start_codon:yes stop_codon:yes gene_type:complete